MENTNKKQDSIYSKLPQKVIDVLQLQVKHELENSNLYLSLANFCEDKAYLGATKFFNKQSLEERDHYKIFAKYLLDRKVPVPIPELGGFNVEYTDLIQLLFVSLRREKSTTDMIKNIYKVAYEEVDPQTCELALMMLKEQVQEEASFITLLDRWKILEGCANGMFLLDKEMGE